MPSWSWQSTIACSRHDLPLRRGTFGISVAPAPSRGDCASAASSRVDAVIRGIMEYSLCVANNMSATFEVALDHAARAGRYFDHSRYMTMYIDIQLGQIAMAQGWAKDAAAHYQKARRVAKKNFELDPIPTAICSVFLQELALECNRVALDPEMSRVPGALVKGATPLQAYAAAAGAVVDLSLRDEGVEGALVVAEEMLAHVHKAGLPALVRYMSALRVSLLALAGRIGDAERVWAADDLPEAAEECLDLAGQTWREMEAISCATAALGNRVRAVRCGPRPSRRAPRCGSGARIEADADARARIVGGVGTARRRGGSGVRTPANVSAYLWRGALRRAADARARGLRAGRGGISRVGTRCRPTRRLRARFWRRWNGRRIRGNWR